MTAQQKDKVRQILSDNNINVSHLGEPENFTYGHEIYETSSNLVIVPIMSNNGKNVTDAWLVDMDNNKTVGHFTFPQDYYSYDRVKKFVNITLNAPIVLDSLQYKNFVFIKADYSSFLDSAPEYINWSGRFINVKITMNDGKHLIRAIIDDTVPRIVGVNDWIAAILYEHSPQYAVIPPGKEKYVYLIPYRFYVTKLYQNIWWTNVIIEPQDAKLYPIIYEERQLNIITNDTATNALSYKDFMTNDTKRYDGNQAVSSGWSANITVNHRDANVYISLINRGTKDIIVEYNLDPDSNMTSTLEEKFSK